MPDEAAHLVEMIANTQPFYAMFGEHSDRSKPPRGWAVQVIAWGHYRTGAAWETSGDSEVVAMVIVRSTLRPARELYGFIGCVSVPPRHEGQDANDWAQLRAMAAAEKYFARPPLGDLQNRGQSVAEAAKDASVGRKFDGT